jgi:hypothetical protein
MVRGLAELNDGNVCTSQNTEDMTTETLGKFLPWQQQTL